MHCGQGFVLDPAGKAYSAPVTRSWIYGSRSAAKGKGAENRREEGKACKMKGKKGRRNKLLVTALTESLASHYDNQVPTVA